MKTNIVKKTNSIPRDISELLHYIWTDQWTTVFHNASVKKRAKHKKKGSIQKQLIKYVVRAHKCDVLQNLILQIYNFQDK